MPISAELRVLLESLALRAREFGEESAIKVLDDVIGSGDINATTNEGLSVLHIASAFGDERVVDALVGYPGVNLKIVGAGGVTPLHLAVKVGCEKVVKILVAKLDINAKAFDDKLFTPLHLAAKGGHASITSHLVAAGASLEEQTIDGMTPLHYAARGGNIDTVACLVMRGADLEAKTKLGFTPLRFAAQNSNTAVTAYLYERGADSYAVAQDGLTPFHPYVCRPYKPSEAFLPSHQPVIFEADPEFNKLHHAALKNDIKLIEELLSIAGVDVNCKTAEGETPLHLAAQNGCIEAAAALMTQDGINVNAKTNLGFTPYDIAVHNNHTDFADLLQALGGVEADGVEDLDGGVAQSFVVPSTSVKMAESGEVRQSKRGVGFVV